MINKKELELIIYAKSAYGFLMEKYNYTLGELAKVIQETYKNNIKHVAIVLVLNKYPNLK